MHIPAMRLMNIHDLKPHEEVDPVNLNLLTMKINHDRFWFIPVLIDQDTSIIMDGHHRYNFALQAGLSVIPCYQLSYSSDKVRVYDWKSGAPFSCQRIIDKVSSGSVFPPKTTRHVFDMVFDTVKIEIGSLY
ncbi:transcriptional regulator [Klebsiella aerogenes]